MHTHRQVLLTQGTSQRKSAHSRDQRKATIHRLHPRNHRHTRRRLPPLRQHHLYPHQYINRQRQRKVLFHRLQQLKHPIRQRLCTSPRNVMLQSFSNERFKQPLHVLLRRRLTIKPQSLLSQINYNQNQSISLHGQLRNQGLKNGAQSRRLHLRATQQLRRPIFTLTTIPHRFQQTHKQRNHRRHSKCRPRSLCRPRRGDRLVQYGTKWSYQATPLPRRFNEVERGSGR